MGNIMNIFVNAISEELIKKIKSLGYHTYTTDFEHNFTIDGIRSNPKCRIFAKKASVCAEDLFLIDNASMDASSRICVNVKIPKVLIKIGRAGFSCTDPEFTCACKGWIQIIDIHIALIVSGNINNGVKLDQVNNKPKVTAINSEFQVFFNKKDCSDAVNSILRSQDPVLLNFVLEFIFKSQEEAIKELINTQLQEIQKRDTAELF